MNMLAADQCSFSESTKRQLRDTYQGHCSICLDALTDEGAQFAHVLDVTTAGKEQFKSGVAMGLLSTNYRRTAALNGSVQCPTCHLGYFTPGHVAMCLPEEILRYLHDYIDGTPKATRKKLFEVFDMLANAKATRIMPPGLPDPQHLLHLVGLFCLVPLNLDKLHRIKVEQPPLSIYQDGEFVFAPSGTSPDIQNVATIFDFQSLVGLVDSPCNSAGYVPLTPTDLSFHQKRYWRLPLDPGAVLVALFERLPRGPYSGPCREVYWAILLQHLLTRPVLPRRHGGEEPSDGGSRSQKRERSESNGNQSLYKKALGNPYDSDEPDSDDTIRSGVPVEQARVSTDDWRKAVIYSPLDEENLVPEVFSPSRLDEDEYEADHCKVQTPPETGDCEEWIFGPGSSTNENVWKARTVSLVW